MRKLIVLIQIINSADGHIINAVFMPSVINLFSLLLEIIIGLFQSYLWSLSKG